MARVLLLDRHGKPLLVWVEDIAYQRNLMGFLTPAARERWNESLRRRGDVGSPDIPEAEEQVQGKGRKG